MGFLIIAKPWFGYEAALEGEACIEWLTCIPYVGWYSRTLIYHSEIYIVFEF